jgi:nicotinamide mononucleotide transporter
LIGALEWLATLSNFGYILLAIRGNSIAWPLGALGACFSFFLFLHPDIRLYSDALLQGGYFLLAVYGFYQWKNQKLRDKVFLVTRVPFLEIALGIFAAIGFSIALGCFMDRMGGDFVFWDAFTTGFSILATFWTAKRYLENWLLWIVVDFFCIFLYLQKGLFLFSLLFAAYCILAIVGYQEWKKKVAII